MSSNLDSDANDEVGASPAPADPAPADPAALLGAELPPVTDTAGAGYEPEPEPEPTPDESPDVPGEEGDTSPLDADTDPAEAYRGTTSSKGDKYIPGVHVFPPQENRSGKWAKVRGRKKGTKGHAEQNTAQVQSANQSATIRKAAERSAFSYAQIHRGIYGDGAAIVGEELAEMIEAWERYYNEKGAPDISPTWGVIMASLGYTHQIATREPNQEKTRELLGGAKEGIKKLWRKMRGLPEPEQVDEKG